MGHTLLVKNIRTLVTCDERDQVLSHVDLRIEDGVITGIGNLEPEAD